MTDPGEIMTIGELATYLKLSKSTLYKLAQEGRLPGQKIGKHWRYRREVIDLWIKSGRTEPERKRKNKPKKVQM